MSSTRNKVKEFFGTLAKVRKSEEFFGFLDLGTGNLTNKGCYKNKEDPSLYICTHLTQFTYYEARIGSDYNF
jgi:hypothetical protein